MKEYRHKLVVSKIIILIIFFCWGSSKSYASQLPQLSSNSIISLVICSPSSSYEGTFGHAALRVQDASLKIDVIFNYGSFNSNQSFLVYKFLMGILDSSLEGSHFADFVEDYRKEGRGMREYYLNLTIQERQRIWEKLNEVLLSGDRFYKFNFVSNNCSTQTRDILFEQLGLHADLYKGLSAGYSYRDIELHDPFQSAWIHLAFNLLLGLNGDEICSVYQAALSPDGLVRLLKEVQMHEREIVLGEHELFSAVSLKKTPLKRVPIICFSLLTFVAFLLSWLQYRKKRSFVLFDQVLFFVSGIIGCFLLFAMIVSDVMILKFNLNILWALPTNMILAFVIRKRKQGRYSVILSRLAGCGIFLFFLCSFVFKQFIPVEAYLFSLALLIRLYFYGVKNLKRDKL